MGWPPPPVWTMFKKTSLFPRDGFPKRWQMTAVLDQPPFAWERMIPSACRRRPSPFSRGGSSLNLKDTHTHVWGSVGNLGSWQWWRRNGRSDRSASLQHYFTDKITTAFYFPAIASNTLKSEKCSAAILFFSLPALCLTWRRFQHNHKFKCRYV